MFGYTIANDVTARDRQVRKTEDGFTWYELGRGKAFDSSENAGGILHHVEPWFGIGFHCAQLSSVYGVLLYPISNGLARRAWLSPWS